MKKFALFDLRNKKQKILVGIDDIKMIVDNTATELHLHSTEIVYFLANSAKDSYQILNSENDTGVSNA